MAVQIHVASSSRVHGAAIVAAGPFGCAETGWWPRLATATTVCMDLQEDWFPFLGPPQPGDSVRITRNLARNGAIDDPDNLADDRVFLFSGSADRTVPTAVVRSLRDYYASFMAEDRVRLIEHIAAGHGFAVTDGEVSCSVTAPPYLNDCDYDTAGQILAFLYPGLHSAAPEQASNLVAFDQARYAVSGRSAGLAAIGYSYIPQSCRERAGCALHVALHGCRQGASQIGDGFYAGAGYNRWAEANRIVVLYPQVEASDGWYGWGANPRGCWDWWGYSGDDYLSRSAPQVRAIMSMVDALLASP